MQSPRPALTVAVIGHVNHGKTSLVRTLTGIETDRLREEIERGLSITPGFAWKALAAGDLDLIDAPGHEDFIRAMVSAAAGAQGVLLAVSAVEGVARQTREHLAIAGLLGLHRGVVAVTRSDLLALEDLPAAMARIAADLKGTVLESAPIMPCSSVTGAGLDALEAALEGLFAEADVAPFPGGPVLPVDRSFSVAGAGAVVTGTLQGGPIAVGDELELQPSGRRVTVRGLQVHGQAAGSAAPVRRTAVNLRGIQAGEISPGERLGRPGAHAPALQMDVVLSVQPGAARPLRHMEAVRVLWGPRQDMARVRLLGERSVPPGGETVAQLRFDAPAVAHHGQKAVLRRPSPAETLGGIRVLDPAAPPARGRARDHHAVLAAAAGGDVAALARTLAAASGGLVGIADLARLLGLETAAARDRLLASHDDLGQGLMVERSAAARAAADYLDRLAAWHADAPLKLFVPAASIRRLLAPGHPRELLSAVETRLAAAGEIRLRGGQVALAGHDPLAALPPHRLERLESLEAAVRAGGATPPDLPALVADDPSDRELVDLLADLGRLVRLRNVALRQTLVFHPAAIEAAAADLAAAFPPPAEFTTGEARAALGTSRKFIVPLLEHLDDLGRTVRTGDVRRMSPPGPPPVENTVAR